MPSKRLFQLRKYPKGPVITGSEGPIYFSNKSAAKAARDLCHAEAQPNDTTVVSLGPDHRNYTTEPKGGF